MLRQSGGPELAGVSTRAMAVYVLACVFSKKQLMFGFELEVT